MGNWQGFEPEPVSHCAVFSSLTLYTSFHQGVKKVVVQRLVTDTSIIPKLQFYIDSSQSLFFNA